MKKKIIIDMSNIYHRSYSVVYSFSGFDLETEKGKKMLINKFLTDLFSIIKKFDNVEKVIFAFDSKNYFRKQISEIYKANRSENKKSQAFYDCINKVYDYFKSQNLNAIKVEGLEADDIIALCANYHSDGYINVIVSNDGDTKQLADENTVIYTANSKNSKLFYSESFSKQKIYENFNADFYTISEIISPFFEIVQKILLGCKTDNVLPLLPKGNGTKFIQKVFNFIELNQLSLADALKNFGHEISQTVLDKQANLVCLSHIYMPENMVFEFFSIIQNNNIPQLKIQNHEHFFLTL